MNRIAFLGMGLFVAFLLIGRSPGFAGKPDNKGFVSIFDGKTLEGWHVSAKTGASTTAGSIGVVAL